MKINKALIGVAAAVAAAALVIVLMVAKNASAPAENTAQTPSPAASMLPQSSPESEENKTEDQTQAAQQSEEEKTYTPTFMYFVSNSDEGHDATMVMIDELKKEFDGKIRFDIRNIDDEPELVNNFPVKDNTPTLIMLNTKNDISNIMFKTKDKDKLTEAIKAAMAN